ncbi:uncharacterized protein LTR77_009989 [Saxophila tyrrhenica]|uniref:Major facilitator superfamily (MFS) profile domain-containing protein n=1 Tax=Saxophila tyrrhenica TaxID=1690608 RepID=A0AAV9NWJ6_9PEZI|nr:hypothetical protein LTR77_009989 [Saxophila tyrrhenica]
MPPNADPTKANGHIDAASETTPLLAAPEHVDTTNVQKDSIPNGHQDHPSDLQADGEQEEEPKPMPYTQILLLCFCSLSEPVAYFSIFPFINEMLSRTGGVPASSVGFYSGLIESLFSLVQMVLMIFYGRAADRLGRKPVLVFSLTGVAFATAGFGMAGSLVQMVVLRCTAGVFAGSVVTVRTMISEQTTKETQGRAFSWYMFVRNVGIFVGPLIGGGLANPAEVFPSVFGHIRFFQDYPYALATFTAGAVVLLPALISFFIIEETLKRKLPNEQSAPAPPLSTWEVLKSPGVPTVLYIFGHIMLLSLSYTAVSPVFMFTPISLGGLSLTDQQIALLIALAGASQAAWMLVAFPPLQRNLGTGRVLRGCAAGLPVFMALYPVLNEMRRAGWGAGFWVAAVGGMVVGSGVAMAFAAIQLCINDIAPSSSVLATLNALALTINSGVRAFAPVVGTSIFASGIKWGFADGHLAWLVLIAWGLVLNVVCWYLPEAAEGRPKPRAKAGDEDRGT